MYETWPIYSWLSERKHLQKTPPKSVKTGYGIFNRHPELTSKYSRKYDHQRALCEDPDIIAKWFNLVRDTVQKYGIADEDIYNFDETGFQMGVIGTAKVLTSSERAGKPFLKQPGNREWVTVIEAANSSGWILPPMIIFQGKVHQSPWFRAIPPDWAIGVSQNGWITNELGIQWIREIFNKHTVHRTKGTHRLLILDGHASHKTPEFDRYCMENSIIPLYMPPHSSHLLQPLDVGCFSPLKRSYGRQVEERVRSGTHHIDKVEFLTLYQIARQHALTTPTVQSGFKARQG
jgi:hypothetical protein